MFFFFNDTATPEIYTLSLHDALPICFSHPDGRCHRRQGQTARPLPGHEHPDSGNARRPSSVDRKSTRLNSSHVEISYAVICLKKKKNISIAPSQSEHNTPPRTCQH